VTDFQVDTQWFSFFYRLECTKACCVWGKSLRIGKWSKKEQSGCEEEQEIAQERIGDHLGKWSY